MIGSIVGTRADLLDVFALHAAGQTRVIYETRPLAAVNDSIQEVMHGKAKVRIVMTPWGRTGTARPWAGRAVRRAGGW